MYMISTLLTPYLFPKWLEVRLVLIICSFIFGASILLIGPVYKGKSLYSMLAGLVISGFLMGPLCIVNMGEMIEATKQRYPKFEPKQTYSMLSGLLNFSLAMG